MIKNSKDFEELVGNLAESYHCDLKSISLEDWLREYLEGNSILLDVAVIALEREIDRFLRNE
jgi:hypothetical protein